METNENEIFVKVPKIYSYQTLVYKNGNRTFPKPRYKEYKKLIGSQLKGLDDIWHKRGVHVDLIFYSDTDTIGDEENIKKPIYDILEDNDKLYNDRYVRSATFEKIVEFVEPEEVGIYIKIQNKEYVLFDNETGKTYVGTDAWLTKYLKIHIIELKEHADSGKPLHSGRFNIFKISNTKKKTYK